ncbi:MAG: MBL fold metallo-hydrolase [Saprospiraceae bacterium]|nr:MBL fold metallo-hydrolase [Saprospiraceae bacterium]
MYVSFLHGRNSKQLINLIKPYLKDEALRKSMLDVDSASLHFQVWWLGQSGFLIHYQGQYLLLDPYLSDSLTIKYANTDKPHIRMTELVIDPSRLDFIDVVTSSHNHTDHLDGDTLIPLIQKNPNLKMVIPEANRQFVSNRIGCEFNWPIGLNVNEKISSGHFTFYGVPAAHNDLDRNEHGQCLYMGYVISFGPWTIYHSGDTLWYEGLDKLLSQFRIDVAFLPINGNKPERRVAGNLNAAEAARLGKEINARLVIPCHYDMFTFNTEDPSTFVEAAEKIGQVCKVMQCGERWTSSELS